jgi:formyltetrahydrofolate synthetase
MKDDLAIARAAKLRKVLELAKDKLGIDADDLEPYGHYKAKLSDELIKKVQKNPEGKLILVTAITPTPAGEGKTTTTVGLGDALNAIGKRAMVCVREPSLGHCFGVKGGGAGGGHAQVAPMEDINLHFTGDFHAISIAHNLLAALVDNHIYFGNQLGFDVRRPTWRRVVDMNDRSLRNIVNGLAARPTACAATSCTGRAALDSRNSPLMSRDHRLGTTVHARFLSDDRRRVFLMPTQETLSLTTTPEELRRWRGNEIRVGSQECVRVTWQDQIIA